ncbi:MAG: GumC family protein [Gemmatimonadaceae bacterium]
MPADLVQSSGGGVQPYGNGAGVAAWQQPPTPAGPSESSMLGNALHRTLSALKRYKWMILATTLFGAAVGFILSKTIQPKYQVNASVWVREKSGNQGPIQPPGLVSANLGWVDLVNSQAVLDSVVVRLALFASPQNFRDTVVLRSILPTDTLVPGAYQLSVRGGTYALTRVESPRGDSVNITVEQGVVGDSVGRAIGISWLPDWSLIARDRPTRFNLVVPREASVRIQRSLIVVLPERTNFMRLILSGSQPVMLASTMNTILDVFLETARRLKVSELGDAYKALEEQRTKAAADLSTAANALERYKVRTITLPSDNIPVAPGITIAQSPVFSAYFGDRTSLSTIKQDRELLQDVLQERRSGGTGWIEKLRTIPNLSVNNPNLDVVVKELDLHRNALRVEQQVRTDSHPNVLTLRKRIQELETQTLPQLATISLNQLQSRERDLSRRVNAAGKELESIPVRSIEENRLQNNFDVAQQVYNELHNRAISAKLAEMSVQPDVSVLERAVPPGRPQTDTAAAIFGIAIAVGLGAGIFLAVMRDRLDKRFRYPEQAVGELGLDILGAIPSFKKKHRNSVERMEEWSQLQESFRSLGLSVRSSFPPQEPIAFTISSPGPGDGKSFIAVNLALVLADAGYRTVLIDGDIRRGRLHETKPLIDCSQSPGLIEHLAGEATLAEVVRDTTNASLSVIPCGARRQQGPELLASEAMQRLVAELRTQYDAVVIDSAPLAAGIDPYALGAASGAMLIVLRAGETDTKLAQAKLGTIDRLPVRLIGSVLNDVGSGSDATYRYFSYLGYEYAPMDEEDARGLIGATSEK